MHYGDRFPHIERSALASGAFRGRPASTTRSDARANLPANEHTRRAFQCLETLRAFIFDDPETLDSFWA